VGVALAVQAYPNVEVPVSYTVSDSRDLLRELDNRDGTGNLKRLLAHFNLKLWTMDDLVSAEEESLESFMARDPTPSRAEGWHRDHARRQATWYSPEAYLATLRPLLNALDNAPGIYAQLNITNRYYLAGVFKQDLLDLQRMFQWAQNHGQDKVRLVID
jgi:hypothetical protein